MKKILILNDDHEMCTLFRLILEREGYLVSTTHNIPDAKEWLRTNTFDLLIMQGAMLGIDWWQFYKSLKADTTLGSFGILVLLHKLIRVEERANQIKKVHGEIQGNRDEVMVELPIGPDLIEMVKRMLGDSGTELLLGVK